MNLTATASMLRRFTPTEEELTAADVLDAIHAEHQRVDGTCPECGEDWPCSKRVQGEQLAVRALGWAADRHLARARTLTQRPERSA